MLSYVSSVGEVESCSLERLVRRGERETSTVCVILVSYNVLLRLLSLQAKSFILERLGKEFEIKGVKGEITHFVIEPFVPHKEEYYLSIYAEV